MRVSLKQLQALSNVPLAPNGVEELVAAIGRQLGAVEEVIDWGELYDGLLVARVVSAEPHPDADKLKICLVDDGGSDKNVPRNNDGYIEVVCGADNVAADQHVVWIPPGAIVPQLRLKGETVPLSAKELRGVVSQGMIASARELAIGDDHSGIVVLDDQPKLGTSLKDLYDLDDTVIDLENKMFTHRPDCFGSLGVARELAGIGHQGFVSPDWYKDDPDDLSGAADKPLEVTVSVDESESVPRFMIAAFDDVKVGPSPLWLKVALSKVGYQSVNNVVDITNLVMHETAQPLHAYDYDKVAGLSGAAAPVVSTRKAKKGETLKLLNGKTVELDEQTTVIATDQAAIGIAGVMGGSETEVDDSTSRIILECGTFEMYEIRRTAMRYGLFSEAVTRFSKGQNSTQNDRAVARAGQLLSELAGVRDGGAVIDLNSSSQTTQTVVVEAEFINNRLGSSLKIEEMAELLRNVEFAVTVDTDQLKISVPFWRHDIAIAEDIVEEVGRLHGYDQIAHSLPTRSGAPAPRNRLIDFKQLLRTTLAARGANEVLSYSFVNEKLMRAAGHDIDQAYRLRNALSPQLQLYRQSLTPSLVELLYPNIRAGYEQPVIFEINKTHTRLVGDRDEPELPAELERIALALSADNKLGYTEARGSAHFAAQTYLRELLAEIGLEYQLRPLKPDDDSLFAAPFNKVRSAVVETDAGQLIGVVGEFNNQLVKTYKLPRYSAGFELDVSALLEHATGRSYKVLSRFPSTWRDITFGLSRDIAFGAVETTLNQAVAESGADVARVEPLSAYVSGGDQRNLSFRLHFVSASETLSAEAVNNQLETIAARVASDHQATVV